MAKQLKFITRKAVKGEKSVLWISKKGNYYSNVIDAKKDNPARAIAYHKETGRITLPPPPPEQKPGAGKSILPPAPPAQNPGAATETKTNKQNLIIYALAAVIAIIILIKIFK